MKRKIDRAIYTGKKYSEHQGFWENESKLMGNAQHCFEFLESQTSEVCNLVKMLSENSFRNIKAIAGESVLNRFVIVLSGLVYVLHRYSLTSPLTLITPTFKTEGEDSEAQLLPFSFQLNDSLTVKELIVLVKEKISKGYHYQNYPLEMVDSLRTDLLSSNILIACKGIHHQLSAQTMFELDCGGDNISISLRGQFDPRVHATLTYFFGHLDSLFSNYDQLETPLTGLELIPEDEYKVLKQFITCESNDLFKSETILSLFSKQVKKTPNALAVKCNEQELSYAEVERLSTNLSFYLKETFHVSEGDFVGAFLERSEHTIVTILGIFKTGAAYVPIDPNYPDERIAHIIEDSDVCVIVHDSNQISKIQGFHSNCLAIEKGLKENWATKPSVEIPASDCLAYMIYTSGTTGKAKGVLIEHGNLANAILSQIETYSLSETDNILQFASSSFDASIYEMMIALCSGATSVIAQHDVIHEKQQFLDLIKNNNVSFAVLPPTYLTLLENHPLESLKVLMTVGETAISKDALYYAQRKRFVNGYGPTECTICTTVYDVPANGVEDQNIPIGTPIKNTMIYILNRNSQHVPVGMAGEICIGGTGVARGYWKKPELTEQKFIPNPYVEGERLYRSGDVGRFLPDGNIEFLGRIDEQIKLHGYRIELGDITNALLNIDGVSEATVFSNSLLNEQVILAFYVSEQKISPKRLKQTLSQKLPYYMVPSKLIQIDAVPMTLNGKVDRTKLHTLAETADKNEIVRPETELQSGLFEIWSGIFNQDSFGIYENYFEMGGDSLKAIQMVARIKDALEVELNVRDLFRNPSIAELETFLNRGTLTKKNDTIQNSREELELFKHHPTFSTVLNNESIEDFYPLSDISHGMLLYSLREITGSAYINCVPMPFEDTNFDINSFQMAVKELVKKHNMLRSVFNLHDYESPVHIVKKDATPEIGFVDLRTLTRHQQEAEIDIQLKAFFHKLPSFENSLLWGITVFQLSNSHYCLGISMHHALMDGWSLGVLITDLAELYHEIKDGHKSHSVPLKVTYKDYIIEQHSLKNDIEVKAFWETELKDYQTLEFVPHGEGHFQKSVSMPLSVTHTKILETLKSQFKIDYKTLCFIAVTRALSVFSYTNDFVIGLLEHGRPVVEDGDKVLGCFLNTVPFRFKGIQGETWRESLRAISEKLTNLKYYGRLSYTEVATFLDPQPSIDTPLFNVLFNYTDFHIYDKLKKQGQLIPEDGLLFELDSQGVTNTKFDITIDYTADEFELILDYDTSFISDEQVQSFIEYFQNVLECLDSSLDRPINKKAILKNHGLQLCSTVLNENEFQSVISGFERSAKRFPDHVALKYEDVTYTYAQLNERANGLANQLNQHIKDKDGNGFVPFSVERSPEMVVAMLAILKAGMGFVPIDPEYPSERIESILSECNATYICVSEQTASKFTPWKGRLLFVDKSDTGGTSFVNRPVTESDLAYVLFTSGSTGKPKGVMISHGSLSDYVQTFKEYYGVDKTDRVIQQASLAFDTSIEEIFPALLSGAEVLISRHQGRDVEELSRLCKQATILSTTPLVLNELNKRNEHYPHLRTIISGGDKLHYAQIDKLVSNYQLYNTYGPTESTVCASFQKIIRPEDVERIGKPVRNREAFICDNHGQLMDQKSLGEIHLSGKGLALGYLNRDDLTKEMFLSHPLHRNYRMYKTGDFGYYRFDGTLEFSGRADQQIKYRGYRIELAEIEKTMLHSDSIDMAAVTLETVENNSVLVGYYTLNSATDPEYIRAWLFEKLPHYMIPSLFVEVDRFSTNANGKIDRNKLPRQQLVLNHSIVAPKTEIEKELVGIWKDVFKTDNIGIQNRFFELGGESIKATQIVSKVYQKYGYKIQFQELFANETIENYAKEIELVLWTNTESVSSEGEELFL